MFRVSTILLFLLVFFLPEVVLSQKSDPEKKNTITNNKVTNRVKGWISQNPGDTILNKKSEFAYKRYEGRIIRKITINHIGFERDINDTSRHKVVNKVARLGNKLHTNTRKEIIRNNLFIKEGKPLDPYKLADNERLLRDLNFIKDARIIVKPIRGNRTMVDVEVYTRDVFSIGGSVRVRSESSAQFSVYDANLGGWGQRTEFRGLVDTERDPNFGTQLLYSKNSIKGTFINATASYTQLNTGASYGLENESALFMRLDRPLVSPYSRLAGGLELSRNWSVNVTNKINTSFRNYTYYVKDFWIGYNMGVKQKAENRNRYFVALRTFGQSFADQPEQLSEELNPIYNNQTYVLGEFTFYNQNFYRTKYVYGFGRTEDVPYGTSISFLLGRIRQLGFSRPYIGFEFDKSIVHKRGNFGEYALKMGALKQKNDLEDITVLASASLFSKLIQTKRLKIRQSARMTYTSILNQRTNMPLQIDNEFGLNAFRADSLLGTTRLSAGIETLMFIRPTLLGFNFAPFLFADMAMIAPKDKVLFRQKPYFALGGGIRTRNENLIFGTVELRMFYFPRVTEDLSQFKISISSNLRVKYSSSFVSAPAFIRYN